MSAAEEAFYAWARDNRRFDQGFALPVFVAGWDAAIASLEQPSLFDDSEPKTIPSRTTDPATSHAAAKAITIKAGTQRARLLEAFAFAETRRFYDAGMTDEQAMEFAVGVSHQSEYSKRCSELREAGYIEPTGETRAGSSGHQRIVSRITQTGRDAVRSL